MRASLSYWLISAIALAHGCVNSITYNRERMVPSSASKHPVSAVLFDYGMVLSGPPYTPAWERLKGILEAKEAEFHAAYWKHRHDYDRGTLNSTTYWQAVAKDLGKPLDETQLRWLLSADVELWAQPNQEMIDWAMALQRAGIRTGILSNIGDAMEDCLLTRLNWLEGFAHHTFSHRLSMAKPELAIYAHAAQGLGVPANEILFIDDREENILAAREAGMQAIQYTGDEAFVQEMHERGLDALLAIKL